MCVLRIPQIRCPLCKELIELRGQAEKEPCGWVIMHKKDFGAYDDLKIDFITEDQCCERCAAKA